MSMTRLNKFILAKKLSFLSFLTIGILTAVINFTSFGFFWKFINLDYKIAVSIAYILSVVFHFTANRNVTFKQQGECRYQVPKYLSIVLLNYVLTMTVMYVVVEIAQLSPYVGSVAAIGVTIATGYIMLRNWVFA